MYRRSDSSGSGEGGHPYERGMPSRERDSRGAPVQNYSNERPSRRSPNHHESEEYYDRSGPDRGGPRGGPPDNYPERAPPGPRGLPQNEYPERGGTRGGPSNEYLERVVPGPRGGPPVDYPERNAPVSRGVPPDYPGRGAPGPRGGPPNDYHERRMVASPNEYPEGGTPDWGGHPDRGRSGSAPGGGPSADYSTDYPARSAPGPNSGLPTDYADRGDPERRGTRGFGPRGGPSGDYQEGTGGVTPPGRGPRGPPDDFQEHGAYWPQQPPLTSQTPPPQERFERGRAPMPHQATGASSMPLSMAEQDFSANYGSNADSISSPAAQPIAGPAEIGQSDNPHDAHYANVSRSQMPRTGGPRGPPDRDGYLGSGQSVNSHMTGSVISNSLMPRLMDEDDDPTHHARGRGGPPRARSPPRDRYLPPDAGPPRRNLYERVQNYNRDPNYPSGGGQIAGSGGGGYSGDRGFPSHPNARGSPPPINYYDYGPSYVEDPRAPSPPARGMDDSAPRRPGLQRVPSQSTISTSGFRSFYSEAYTLRGDQSTIQSDYRHHYEGSPPPAGDDYVYSGASVGSRSMRSFGGSTWDTRGSLESRSAGYGGGYYGGPPPPQRGHPPPPSRDYSPHDGPPSRVPPPSHYQTPERPLLEVAPGLMMHLMGTEETMQAIQQGHITVTSCVVCGMDIHCHSASEYVLCPDCRVVSPVNQLDNAEMTPQQGGLVGLGVKTEMLITMMEAGAGQY